MSDEPVYIRQNGDCDPDNHRAWFRECAAEARALGCTFGRHSVHPDNERLVLVEGWLKQPKDQGEVRWAFQITEPKPEAGEWVDDPNHPGCEINRVKMLGRRKSTEPKP